MCSSDLKKAQGAQSSELPKLPTALGKKFTAAALPALPTSAPTKDALVQENLHGSKEEAAEANAVLKDHQNAARMTTHAFDHFREQQKAKIDFLRAQKAKQLANKAAAHEEA